MNKHRFTSKILIRTLVLAAALALPLSIYLIEKKMFGSRFIASTEDRTEPQGTAENDLSEIAPADFQKAFKYQVLKSVFIEKSSAGSGISIGNFIIRDKDRNKIFACDKYKTIDFIFAAEGMAFSGEIPKMLVRGRCLVNSDQTHIEALPIPFAQILKSPLTQDSFSNETPGSNEVVSIYFKNVTDFWPTEWTWIGLTLHSEDSNETLNITGYEIISVLGNPVIIKP